MYTSSKNLKYEKFCKQHKIGIDRIFSIIPRAMKLYDELAKEINDNKVVEISSHLAEHLSPIVLDYVKEAKSGKIMSGMFDTRTDYYIMETHHERREEFEMNIFGYLKNGERSIYELRSDIESSHTTIGKDGIPMFDMDNAVMVGWFIEKDGVGSLLGARASHCHFAFDISAVLIRMFTYPEFNKETQSYNNNPMDKISPVNVNEVMEMDILNTMVNKMLMLSFNRYQFLKVLKDENILTEGYVNDRWCAVKAVDAMKALFVYKSYYNSINGLTDREFEYSTKELMDLVNNIQMTQGYQVGIQSSFTLLQQKFVNGNFDVLRYPDAFIYNMMDIYRTTLNHYYKRDNLTYAKGDNIGNSNLPKRHPEIGYYAMESTEFRKFLEPGGIEDDEMIAVEALDELPGVVAFIGLESYCSSDFPMKNYKDFLRNGRAVILMELSEKERGKFKRFENDIIKLKSDIINCRTQEIQSALIRRGQTISKLIDNELSNSGNSELFNKLLNLLEGERISLITDLSERNFTKEQRFLLYSNPMNEFKY